MGRNRSSLDRIVENVCFSEKTKAFLATAFKGFQANGNTNIIELYEKSV